MAFKKMRKTFYQLSGGVNEKTSKYTRADSQVDALYNMDFNIPNALSKRPGSTQMVTVGTSGPINSFYEFERLSGASYLVASSDTALFYLQSAAWTEISSGYTNDQPFDFLTFTDRLYACNGQTFLGWTGESLYPFGLPGTTYPASATTIGPGTLGMTFLGEGTTAGLFATFHMAFVRSDGFIGPGYVTFIATDQVNDINFITTSGWSSIHFSGFTVPAGQGITAIALYYSQIRGDDSNISQFIVNGTNQQGIFNYLADNLAYITMIPASQQTFILDANAFNFPSVQQNNPGFSGSPFAFGSTYIPRYMAIADERAFLTGFSVAPSVVFFSDPGEPESIQPENFFEVRTDDGDRITGITEFQDEIIPFKRKSFHRLVGDRPDNYDLKELSTEYGLVSNKAIAEFHDILLFLDEKGVVRFDGAGWRIISDLVEPTFRRMNLEAAIDQATAAHVEFRNQVWFGIPVDGSSVNNLTVVYDYLLNAWTFFDGYSPAAFGNVKQGLAREYTWFGDYSGIIHYFNPSFYGDNGQGITCLIKSKFDSPDGENVTNIFRQFFMDVNTPSGLTGTIQVSAYKDYNRSSVQATFSVFQDQFQTREDFGVPAKSVAFDMSHNSASLPLEVYGFTVRRRFLREV